MTDKDKEHREKPEAKDVFNGSLDNLSKPKKQQIIKLLLDEHRVPRAEKEDKEVEIPKFEEHSFRIPSE